ncbi:hypothetical protein [Halorussus halophilus]|uniref:hypothetical protein n=1 Tax=Halorussus halophilus TaxID=2650975 RepID=UPI001300E546|nr:hypothetical protein [Halorussus halophilus]
MCGEAIDVLLSVLSVFGAITGNPGTVEIGTVGRAVCEILNANSISNADIGPLVDFLVETDFIPDTPEARESLSELIKWVLDWLFFD